MQYQQRQRDASGKINWVQIDLSQDDHYHFLSRKRFETEKIISELSLASFGIKTESAEFAALRNQRRFQRLLRARLLLW